MRGVGLTPIIRIYPVKPCLPCLPRACRGEQVKRVDGCFNISVVKTIAFLATAVCLYYPISCQSCKSCPKFLYSGFGCVQGLYLDTSILRYSFFAFSLPSAFPRVSPSPCPRVTCSTLPPYSHAPTLPRITVSGGFPAPRTTPSARISPHIEIWGEIVYNHPLFH